MDGKINVTVIVYLSVYSDIMLDRITMYSLCLGCQMSTGIGIAYVVSPSQSIFYRDGLILCLALGHPAQMPGTDVPTPVDIGHPRQKL